ncbi:BTAD domain-containing putative transcriptional regulator [Nocardiopsis sp. RSe5-2]|uniref:BTAD domain-containing putative transcriptional regulator n=1 Tax=Nocardiopsis endophytica TaxID=3018445 RepID=A0ABT4TYL9_9ACTN|nr:BTAD domain-containing putative transcriptional regulator [Nocardiopsis endophytica]MDA2809344.1 BTAD domain-containing putative transcriptional regulator [Nocardiopsis endophytica]
MDLHRFRDLAARGHAAGSTEEAVALWERALECWKGRPFSGTGSDRLWYALGQPLVEEQWATVTAWADGAFALGRYDDVVTRLTPLVREDPLRERLQYLLIAALNRSGQRAAALSAYQENRRYLAEELGVDPSPELVGLQERILTDTEGRDAPAADAAPEPAAAESPQAPWPTAATRNDLPRDLPDFTGRQEDVRELLEAAERGEDAAPVYVVTGPGGVGKTSLVVHAAHLLEHRYPDGAFFIDLNGFSPEQAPASPEAALGTLLRAVGVAPEAIPDTVEERSAMWRARLAGRRVLVVLDNAAGYAQVHPLLAAAGSFTLITSRHDLPGLSGVGHLSLDMLGSDDSLRLLEMVLGKDRVTAEPEDAAEVVQLCGGLPLALRIIAGRMLHRRRWTFAHVRQRLGEERRRFLELRVEGQSVEAVFELSYRSLTDEQRRIFCLLGTMIGGSIDLMGAADLLDADPPDADDLLQELVSVCLLDEPSVDVYRFHDLIGDYARQKAAAELEGKEADGARWRLAEHYLQRANEAAGYLGPRAHEYDLVVVRRSRYESGIGSREEAVAWFETHQDNLVSVVDYFADRQAGEHTWQIADAVWRFYAVHGRTELLVSTHEKALAASRQQGSERGSAVTLIGLGIAQGLAGRYALALDLLQEAKELLTKLGDDFGLMRVEANIGSVYERLGRFRDAAATLTSVLEHARRTDNRALEYLQLLNLGVMKQMIGEHEEAIALGRTVLDGPADFVFPDMRAVAFRVIGDSYTGLEDYDQAVHYLEQGVIAAQECGDHSSEVFALNGMAAALSGRGEAERAVEAHLQALELSKKVSLGSADSEILYGLGLTYGRAGRVGEAQEAYEKALRIARERKERYAEGKALLGLGTLQQPKDSREAETARDRLSAATAIFMEMGVPEADEARDALKRLGGRVPAPRIESVPEGGPDVEADEGFNQVEESPNPRDHRDQ